MMRAASFDRARRPDLAPTRAACEASVRAARKDQGVPVVSAGLPSADGDASVEAPSRFAVAS